MCLVLPQRLQTGQKESSICCSKCWYSFLARHPFLRNAFLRSIMELHYQRQRPPEIILLRVHCKKKNIHGFLVGTPRDVGWKAAVLAAEVRAQQAGAPPMLKPSEPAVAELSRPQVHIWISRTDLRPGCCLHFAAPLGQPRCCGALSLSPSAVTTLGHWLVLLCCSLTQEHLFSTVKTHKRTLSHEVSHVGSQFTLQAFAHRLF